jgi:molybdopterin/thiamine biosynthesis adenylyltransferase
MKRFLIIGAGGVGSHLAEPLARMLEYSDTEPAALIIVDGDYYEPKNKQRQSFTEIGNKAQVLANDLAHVVEKTMLAPLPMWVVSDEAVAEDGEPDPEDVDDQGNPNAGKIAASALVQNNDVVYAVVDNFAARSLLLEAGRGVDNVDIFCGGNDDNMFGSVYHYRRRDGKDITQNPNDFKPEFMDPADRNPGELSCQERAEIDGGTQLIAANLGVAALLIGRTQAAIIEEGDPSEQVKVSDIFFDLNLGMMNPFDRRLGIEETVEEQQLETAAG